MPLTCFIHSCTNSVWGTEILEYLITYNSKSGLLKKLDAIYINNVGIEIDTHMFNDEKIIIMNYSSRIDGWENTTLKIMHFYALTHPEDKLLYLHTKGCSHDKNSPINVNIRSWVEYMLYALVHNHDGCTEILDYVDTVGVSYEKPSSYGPRKWTAHFSGNFWWVNAAYYSTNPIYNIEEKYDAECHHFNGSPRFVNLFKLTGMYGASYPVATYADKIEDNIKEYLRILPQMSSMRIFYGTRKVFIDVTEICVQKCVKNNIFYIPPDSGARDELFGDPMYGVHKFIKIGSIEVSENEEIRLPY